MAVSKSFSIEDKNLNTISVIGTRSRDYSDIDLSFAKKTSGEIFKKTDAAAVKQAIKTLIQTNFGEKPFNYFFGANIRSLLFEPAGPDVVEDIRTNIELAIENFEPRVELLETIVLDEIDKNSINVSIRFKIINTEEIVVLETSFSRLR